MALATVSAGFRRLGIDPRTVNEFKKTKLHINVTRSWHQRKVCALQVNIAKAVSVSNMHGKGSGVVLDLNHPFRQNEIILLRGIENGGPLMSSPWVLDKKYIHYLITGEEVPF